MILWALIIGIGLVAIILLLFLVSRKPEPNLNSLAIGEKGILEEIDLVIRSPLEFDYKSRDEILQLRREAVYWYPDLLAGDYVPDAAIFGQIVDGLPWWGIAGQFYYGQGEQSIEGSSEESRFILNPFMLIAAEPHTIWDRTALPEEQVRRPGFEFYCDPTWLRWEPKKSFAEVTYSSDCAARLGYRTIDLISYNARDFNLNYIFVSYPDSVNVDKHPRPTEPYAIPHYIHQGSSCAYPGGCNNMSPATPPIDALELTASQAKIVIWLWRESPGSLADIPDMVYVIRFQ